jgi:NAD(P)-dependent dehydrogenase (short-subunit alcohol dehydrogenase family)
MNTIRTLTIALSLVVSGLAAWPAAVDAADDGQKAVLVTGASSGIGRRITEVLAERGHYVYAGARKDADLAALNALENVQGVRLDVTKQADIDAAVELVSKAGRGLYAVVNNAGVGVFSPMNETPESDIDFVFDVNVYGPYRINKAFAPMLVESKGRTTTIGSISGFVSGARSGTYSMSKFAVEAYTDALAAEMADAGVHVSVIEPGSYKSKIREKVVLHAMGKTPEQTGALSEEEQKRLDEMLARNEALKEPDEVAEATLHALFAERPRRRYMVVPNEEQAETTIRTALTRAVELNADQPYSYDRDELVKMLEEIMQAQ